MYIKSHKAVRGRKEKNKLQHAISVPFNHKNNVQDSKGEKDQDLIYFFLVSDHWIAIEEVSKREDKQKIEGSILFCLAFSLGVFSTSAT